MLLIGAQLRAVEYFATTVVGVQRGGQHEGLRSGKRAGFLVVVEHQIAARPLIFPRIATIFIFLFHAIDAAEVEGKGSTDASHLGGEHHLAVFLVAANPRVGELAFGHLPHVHIIAVEAHFHQMAVVFILHRERLGLEVGRRSNRFLIQISEHRLIVKIIAPLAIVGIRIDEAQSVKYRGVGVAAGAVKNQLVAVNRERHAAFRVYRVLVDVAVHLHAGQAHAVVAVVEPVDHLAEGHGDGVALHAAFHPSVSGGMRDDVLQPARLAVLTEHYFLHDAGLALLDEEDGGIGCTAVAHVDTIIALGLVADDAVLVGGYFRDGSQLWTRFCNRCGLRRCRYGEQHGKYGKDDCFHYLITFLPLTIYMPRIARWAAFNSRPCKSYDLPSAR